MDNLRRVYISCACLHLSHSTHNPVLLLFTKWLMALVLRQWLHTFMFREGRVSTPSFKGIMSRIFTTQQEMARYSDDRNNDNKEYYSNIVPLNPSSKWSWCICSFSVRCFPRQFMTIRTPHWREFPIHLNEGALSNSLFILSHALTDHAEHIPTCKWGWKHTFTEFQKWSTFCASNQIKEIEMWSKNSYTICDSAVRITRVMHRIGFVASGGGTLLPHCLAHALRDGRIKDVDSTAVAWSVGH